MNLQIVYTDGKPTRAIIGVEALDALLECAEDAEDRAYLASLTAEDRQAITLEQYLESVRRDADGARAEGDRENAESEDVSDRHRQAS